jgi:hypothetical protein
LQIKSASSCFQIVADVAAVSTQNFQLFDQLSLMSMNKDLLNEEHMRSVGTVIKYITVGHSPFVQTNTPHRFLNSFFSSGRRDGKDGKM